ncbi:MAG TPA: nitrate reductase associated protein [Pararobbsia sp.]|nr:nitrate reductase associated protein [Pararobbsia sp.]
MNFASSPCLFSFERAHTDPLAFIPLGVRFYLDRCGLRLSLAQWQWLPEASRARLASIEPALGETSASAFGALLTALMADAPGGPIERQTPEGADMLAPDRVPDAVVSQAAQHGVDGPSQQAWTALSVGQRYALAKLARKARRSDDFAAAMAEFGIVSRG